MHRVSLFAALFAILGAAQLESGCPQTPPGGCSVCGEGSCVTAPDAVFEFPGFPSTPCGLLEEAGYMGGIPLESCPFLPNLVVECQCLSEPTPAPVTPAPVAPTVPVTCRPVPSDGCSICGKGSCVTAPDAVFEFPGMPPAPCGGLQEAGYESAIPLESCQFLPGLIGVCDCALDPRFDACPPTPLGGCSVCGEGMCVTEPNALFQPPSLGIGVDVMIPGYGLPCGELELAGYQGVIPAQDCDLIRGFAGTSCACDTVRSAGLFNNVSLAPIEPVAPTRPPTPTPTNGGDDDRSGDDDDDDRSGDGDDDDSDDDNSYDDGRSKMKGKKRRQ